MVISETIKSNSRTAGFNYSFKWIGEQINAPSNRRARATTKSSRSYYRGFQLNTLNIYEGSDVLVKVEERFDDFCEIYDVARVVKCFYDKTESDPRRVQVQWYTHIDKVKRNHMKNIPQGLPALDGDLEVVRDLWGYGTEIDVESISGLCCIVETVAASDPGTIKRPPTAVGPLYVCRFIYKKVAPWLYPLTDELIHIPPNLSPLKQVPDKSPAKLLSLKSPLRAVGNNEDLESTVTHKAKSRYSGLKKTSSRKTNEKENLSPGCADSERSPVICLTRLESQPDNVTNSRRKSNVKRKLLDLDTEESEVFLKKRKNDSHEAGVGEKKKQSKSVSSHMLLVDDNDMTVKPSPRFRKLKTDEINQLLSDEENDFCSSPKKKSKRRKSVLPKWKAASPRRASMPAVSLTSIHTAIDLADSSDDECKGKTQVKHTPRRKSKLTEKMQNTSLKLTANKKPSEDASQIAKKSDTFESKRTPTKNCVKVKDKVQEGRTPKRESKLTEKMQNTSLRLSINRAALSGDIATTPKKNEKNGVLPLHNNYKDSTSPRTLNVKLKNSLARTPQKKTPMKSSKKNTPKRNTPITKLPRRYTPIRKSKTEFDHAREQLQVSAVPSSLPCREDEFQQIFSFVEGKLLDATGGCMYVSGVPGTGKTATVREVVRVLRDCEKDGSIPPFDYIEANAMKLTKPHQLWVQIWEDLRGERVTADHACSLVEKLLTSSSAPRQKSLFLLLDELDLLWTRKQDVMYNLFDWSSRVGSRLVVVAIANTMDLPERMMISRVSSRLGLTRMTFQPYTFQQLQEIIASRLHGIKAFDPDAVQLVARKVAAVSGDARRALDVCRRATELAERDTNQTVKSPIKSPGKINKNLVGMTHVSDAIGEMFSSPKIVAIRRCSQMERYILQAILAEFSRVGIEEALLDKVLQHLCEICRMDGIPPPSTTETLFLIGSLAAQRIIFMEHSRLDLSLRLRLNISVDDVTYALNA